MIPSYESYTPIYTRRQWFFLWLFRKYRKVTMTLYP